MADVLPFGMTSPSPFGKAGLLAPACWLPSDVVAVALTAAVVAD